MLLTPERTAELLTPHVDRLLRWHEQGYKERRRTMTTLPDQWAAMDGTAVPGFWTHQLILDAAAHDPHDACSLHRDGHVNFMRLSDGEDQVVARLRPRRVELHTPWSGSRPQPYIATPLSPTARDWFGNRHLREAQQLGLLGDEPDRQPVNLLLGHTADTVLGEFERLYVVCYDGTTVEWFFELTDVDGTVAAPARELSRRAVPMQPKDSIPIHPKEKST